MKKIFVVSLLLVSVFLIGNSGTALAQCMDYQDYECTFVWYLDGAVDYVGVDPYCIELCFDDGFEVYATDYMWFEAWLYPATDNRHLLGTIYDYYYSSWGGCSIEFKGRSLIFSSSYIQDGNGWVLINRCTPSNNCF